jgi:hypothetical protein
MRAAALLLALAGCASAPPVSTPLPPAPPANVTLACALPEVVADAFEALIDHRLALVECRSAALVNEQAWRRIATP